MRTRSCTAALPAALALAVKRAPRSPPSFTPRRLAAARAAFVRAEIIPASSSATAAICCNRNLPVAPSIIGRSANRTSTPASSRREAACPGSSRAVILQFPEQHCTPSSRRDLIADAATTAVRPQARVPQSPTPAVSARPPCQPREQLPTRAMHPAATRWRLSVCVRDWQV
jgi:hypothetical protein